jgi:apolipoprotein N-acyltransferase
MRRFQRAGLAAQAASLLAGAALPLSLAPLDWWPVAPLALCVLLLAALHGSPAAAAWRGWLFGLGSFGVGTSWIFVSIHTYGDASAPLAGLLTFLFCGGLALFTALGVFAWARWMRGRPGGVLLGFPAMWVLTEWLREWCLTGFPWLYAGYSQVDGPLSGWAPVVGVYGLGLMVAGSAAVIASVAAQPREDSRARRIALAVMATIWLAGWPLSHIEWSRPSGKPLSVAMVQGNIPQLLKWEPDHLQNTLGIYAKLSRPLWGSDLVVWPESSVPAYFDTVADFLAEQATQAAAGGSTLLLGLPSREDDPSSRRGYAAFNSVVALGAESGIYHKRHLVPFGEYVPLESTLRGLIAFFDLPMSSFSSGPADQALLRGAGTAIAPLVCYEIVYPELVRGGVLAGATLLLTVSNDTWFGASLGPLQHLQMAQMRALENSRDLVRATNDGISALIDHQGRITVRGAQFTREVIRGEVQPREGLTPFARLGCWPVIGLCLLMLLPALARRGLQPSEDDG